MVGVTATGPKGLKVAEDGASNSILGSNVQCQGTSKKPSSSSEQAIDVVRPTKPGNTLFSLLTSLQETSADVSSKISSTLGLTSFSAVKVSDLTGKGNTKVSRQFLVEHVLTLLNLSNEISNCMNFVIADHVVDNANGSSNQGTPNNSCVLSPDCIAQIERRIADELNNTSVVQNHLLESIQSDLSLLKTSIDQFKLARPTLQSDTHVAATITAVLHPSPVSVDVTNPTKHVEQYITNYLSDQVESELSEFLSNQSYTDVNGRSVIDYGATYKYTGSPSNPRSPVPIPDPIKSVMDAIRRDYPQCGINQCVVNRYRDGSSLLPEHSDDESTLKPKSSIYTLSLGAPRDITFRDIISDTEEIVTAESRSLYIMSQPSQSLWTHRIKPESSEVGTRYSLTFRCVGSNFSRSCVILGDSNTKHLKFGDSRGTFGWRVPGERVETFHIRNIDPSACIGYQNISLHVGINDLRDRSPGRTAGDPDPHDTRGHLDNLIAKINIIQKLCPKSRLIVSPVLPTKSLQLNQRVISFNRQLCEYATNCNTHIKYLNFMSFVNIQGTLDSKFGVYNNPLDTLHLGKLGIRLLAKTIRDGVVGRYIDSRSYSSVVVPRNVDAGPFSRPGLT